MKHQEDEISIGSILKEMKRFDVQLRHLYGQFLELDRTWTQLLLKSQQAVDRSRRSLSLLNE
jgi:hypothetical protein